MQPALARGCFRRADTRGVSAESLSIPLRRARRAGSRARVRSCALLQDAPVRISRSGSAAVRAQGAGLRSTALDDEVSHAHGNDWRDSQLELPTSLARASRYS